MKETDTDTEKRTTKRTTRSTTTSKDTKKVKKTTTKETKEIVEPEFKSIQDEIRWLNKKKNKDEMDEQRLRFLEQPVRVIGPTQKERAEAKKISKTSKGSGSGKSASHKPVVRLENGEFLPTPTNLSKLKSYITRYVKAIGWKAKNYTFPDTKSLSITDVKITSDKETNTVTFIGRLVWQNPKQLFSHSFKKVFTLENHDIRNVIVQTYRFVNKNLKGKETVPSKFFYDMNWEMVYDV